MLIKALIILAMVCLAARASMAQKKGEFALFLLPSNVKAKDLDKLDLRKIKPTGKPFIGTEDIWSYVKDTHAMVLNYDAGIRLRRLDVPVTGRPFVVFAGDEPVYAGAFWTSLSSFSFPGVVINVSDLTGDFPEIKFTLGYPTSAEQPPANDPRSDPRLLLALQNNGRLREEVWLRGRCREIHPTGKRRQSFVFTFDVTAVIRSAYKHNSVTFEIFDDTGKSLRSAVGATWSGTAYAEKNLQCDAKKEILLTFERLVSERDQPLYLKDFETQP